MYHGGEKTIRNVKKVIIYDPEMFNVWQKVGIYQKHLRRHSHRYIFFMNLLRSNQMRTTHAVVYILFSLLGT